MLFFGLAIAGVEMYPCFSCKLQKGYERLLWYKMKLDFNMLLSEGQIALVQNEFGFQHVFNMLPSEEQISELQNEFSF